MYTLRLTQPYQKSLEKIITKDEILQKRLILTLQKLALNPTHSSLRSHKVNTPHHGVRWSSWVTGDVRIIWDYDDKYRLVIILLAIGGHSGIHKVYK